MPDSTDKQKMQKPLDIVKFIKGKTENLSDTAWYCSLKRTLHDCRWSLQEGFENNFKGYCDADIINFGDRLVEHYAELLFYLSEQEYIGDDAEEYKQKLRAISDNFANYCTLVDELGDMGMLEGVGVKSKLIMSSLESIRAKFEENWLWVGENLLGENFRMPEHHAFESSSKEVHVESYYDSIPRKTAKAVFALRNATERAVSPNMFSRRDISQMPKSELKRTSDMLYQFNRSNIGCPCEYRNSENGLKTRDGNWGKRQAIASSIMGNPSITKGLINIPMGGGTATIAENDVDADFNAWTEDIVYAEEVIDTWCNWINEWKDGMRVSGAEDSQIEEIERILKAEFFRTWRWIGKNITALWI